LFGAYLDDNLDVIMTIHNYTEANSQESFRDILSPQTQLPKDMQDKLLMLRRQFTSNHDNPDFDVATKQQDLEELARFERQILCDNELAQTALNDTFPTRHRARRRF